MSTPYDCPEESREFLTTTRMPGPITGGSDMSLLQAVMSWAGTLNARSLPPSLTCEITAGNKFICIGRVDGQPVSSQMARTWKTVTGPFLWDEGFKWAGWSGAGCLTPGSTRGQYSGLPNAWGLCGSASINERVWRGVLPAPSRQLGSRKRGSSGPPPPRQGNVCAFVPLRAPLSRLGTSPCVTAGPVRTREDPAMISLLSAITLSFFLQTSTHQLLHECVVTSFL